MILRLLCIWLVFYSLLWLLIFNFLLIALNKCTSTLHDIFMSLGIIEYLIKSIFIWWIMNEPNKNTCKVIVLLSHYRPKLPKDFSNVLACHDSSQSGFKVKNINVNRTDKQCLLCTKKLQKAFRSQTARKLKMWTVVNLMYLSVLAKASHFPQNTIKGHMNATLPNRKLEWNWSLTRIIYSVNLISSPPAV
jgi:hypothetical protein